MNKASFERCLVTFSIILCFQLIPLSGIRQEKENLESIIDQKVKSFLISQRYKWKEDNIPFADGKVLYNLILRHEYTKALEVGTSTGHSAIWMAWALSKTGGKLITIEIDEERHRKALENFAECGLTGYIDARLADAHDFVPKLEGPFDFVFIDADKDWYTNYFKMILPKLEAGGCFTAHNVSNLKYNPGIKKFLDYVKNLPHIETTIDQSSWTGISISYKRGETKSEEVDSSIQTFFRSVLPNVSLKISP